jgi:hypothetical protein
MLSELFGELYLGQCSPNQKSCGPFNAHPQNKILIRSSLFFKVIQYSPNQKGYGLFTTDPQN